MLLQLLLISSPSSSSESSSSSHDTTTTTTTTTTGTVDDDPHLRRAQAVYDWVRLQEGGIINPKQELRRSNPGDVSSHIGVFAKETILSGEILTRIPWNITIQPEEIHPQQLACSTVLKLQKELLLGNSSKYGPHVHYLQYEQPQKQLLYGWSTEGKNIFQFYVLEDYENQGEGRLPPYELLDWIKLYLKQDCSIDVDVDPELTMKAVSIILSRSDDSFLIPGYVSC
jgi:hypothetical protein